MTERVNGWLTWPFLIGQKANGCPPDKSLKSKKQKLQQRIRKEKPQQHNFTHRLLAAALKVHGYPAQHVYRKTHGPADFSFVGFCACYRLLCL